VFFKGDPKDFPIDSIEALDFLGFTYEADWPVDILLDQGAMDRYNTIFSFLVRIRRCNYLIQKRDFWLTMPVPKSTTDLNLRD
jgi:hypothetical protein